MLVSRCRKSTAELIQKELYLNTHRHHRLVNSPSFLTRRPAQAKITVYVFPFM
jgi:hypothetical protein